MHEKKCRKNVGESNVCICIALVLVLLLSVVFSAIFTALFNWNDSHLYVYTVLGMYGTFD